jgi:uncharacterized protein (TIGR00369 family)
MSARPLSAADPRFEERVRASYARQNAMRLIGATIERVEPGEVEIALPRSAEIAQQHGFVHGGLIGAVLDTACGFASLSLMPADAGVLTVEYKINFLAPAAGDRFRMVGRVRKAGRTLTFAEAEAFAQVDGSERLIATMTATMMTIVGRDEVRD